MTVILDQRLGDDEHGEEADGAFLLTQLRADGTYRSEFDNALDVRIKAAGVAAYVLESLGYIYDPNGNRTDVREFDYRVTLPDDLHIAAVTSIMESHAALVPGLTKATIQADNVDSTVITLPGQQSFAVRVWYLHGIVGQMNVADGSLVFLTDTPGQYIVELSLNGNTGFVVVEAI